MSKNYFAHTYLWITLGAVAANLQNNLFVFSQFIIIYLFPHFSPLLTLCTFRSIVASQGARARARSRSPLFVPIAFVFTRFRIGNVTNFLSAVYCPCRCLRWRWRWRRRRLHVFVLAHFSVTSFCTFIQLFICSRALISSAFSFHLCSSNARR